MTPVGFNIKVMLLVLGVFCFSWWFVVSLLNIKSRYFMHLHALNIKNTSSGFHSAATSNYALQAKCQARSLKAMGCFNKRRVGLAALVPPVTRMGVDGLAEL